MKKKSLAILWCFMFLMVFNISLFSRSLGDLNHDKVIDSTDSFIVVKYIRGRLSEIISKSKFTEEFADVDCNGKVTITDALLIAQYWVGMIDHFPCEIKKPIKPPKPTTLPEPIDQSKIQLGKAFKIKYGQTMIFDGGKRIKFSKVISDSRCPANADCNLPGELEISLYLKISGMKKARFTLSSINNKEEPVGDYIFRMESNVLPLVGAIGEKLNDKQYIITLTISKKTSSDKKIWVSNYFGSPDQNFLYSTPESVKDFFEGKGIKVYNIKDIFDNLWKKDQNKKKYYVAISIKDLELAEKLSWNQENQPYFWVSHSSGRQCQPETYPNIASVKRFFNKNGIETYGIKRRVIDSCEGCDCPSGILYYTLISPKSIDEAKKLGWQLDTPIKVKIGFGGSRELEKNESPILLY